MEKKDITTWESFASGAKQFLNDVVFQYVPKLIVACIVLFVGWKLGRAVIHDELTNGGTLKVPAWLSDTLFFLIRFLAPAAFATIAVFQWV